MAAGNNRIELPLDLPGYEEAIRKITELIRKIKEIEAQQKILAKSEKQLTESYSKGETTLEARDKQLNEYYDSLARLSVELLKARKLKSEWSKYAVAISENDVKALEKYSANLMKLGEIGASAKTAINLQFNTADLESAKSGIESIKSELKDLIQTQSEVIDSGEDVSSELEDLSKSGLGVKEEDLNLVSKYVDELKELDSLKVKAPELETPIPVPDAGDVGALEQGLGTLTEYVDWVKDLESLKIKAPEFETPTPVPDTGGGVIEQEFGSLTKEAGLKSRLERFKERTSESLSSLLSRDFTKGMDDATDSTRDHKSAADSNSRAISIEARRFKWMLGFILMGTNAIKKIAGQTQVFSKMWEILGSAFGFIIDMVIMPMIPFVIWLVTGLYNVGKAIKDINDKASDVHPVLGALVSLFEILVGAAIVDGIFSLVTGSSLLGSSLLGAFGASTLLIGALEILAAGVIVAIVLKIFDKTGLSDWIARSAWMMYNALQDIVNYMSELFQDIIDFLITNSLRAIPIVGIAMAETYEKYRAMIEGDKEKEAMYDYQSQLSLRYAIELLKPGSNPIMAMANALRKTSSEYTEGHVPFTESTEETWRQMYPEPWTFYGTGFDAFKDWIGLTGDNVSVIENATAGIPGYAQYPDFEDYFEQYNRATAGGAVNQSTANIQNVNIYIEGKSVDVDKLYEQILDTIERQNQTTARQYSYIQRV